MEINPERDIPVPPDMKDGGLEETATPFTLTTSSVIEPFDKRDKPVALGLNDYARHEQLGIGQVVEGPDAAEKILVRFIGGDEPRVRLSLRDRNLFGPIRLPEYVIPPVVVLPAEAAPDAGGIKAGLLTRDMLADLPQPEWLVEGILTRHAYAVLAGRRSTYKSFVALDWMLSLATGRTWQGRDTQQVRCLYVVGEGANGLEQRVSAWEQAWGIEVDPDWFVTYPKAINLFKGHQVGELVDVVSDGKFGLVGFDTLRRMSSGADANQERDMGPVIDNLERVKRATEDGSVLVVAHTDAANTKTRGSTAIEDDAEIVWRTDRDDGGNLELSCSKMKDAPDGAVVRLRAKPSHGSLIIEATGGTSSAEQPSMESQIKVLDALRFSFIGGAPSGKLLAASGLPDRTFYRAITALVQAGHVANTGTDKRPHYVITERVTAT